MKDIWEIEYPSHKRMVKKLCIESHEMSSRHNKRIAEGEESVANEPLHPAKEFVSKILPKRSPLFEGWDRQFWKSNHPEMNQSGKQNGCVDVKERPVMCVYKVISVSFNHVYGLRRHVVQFIHNRNQRLMLDAHLRSYLWLDEWHGLTMEDIREYERETKDLINENIKSAHHEDSKGG